MTVHRYDKKKKRIPVSPDSIPSGICSTISVRHEGECPVQKYGLRKKKRVGGYQSFSISSLKQLN